MLPQAKGRLWQYLVPPIIERVYAFIAAYTLFIILNKRDILSIYTPLPQINLLNTLERVYFCCTYRRILLCTGVAGEITAGAPARNERERDHTPQEEGYV